MLKTLEVRRRCDGGTSRPRKPVDRGEEAAGADAESQGAVVSMECLTMPAMVAYSPRRTYEKHLIRTALPASKRLLTPRALLGQRKGEATSCLARPLRNSKLAGAGRSPRSGSLGHRYHRIRTHPNPGGMRGWMKQLMKQGDCRA